jgi:hypothetical protein
MKLITVSMLRGACRSQRALFRKTFPDGAPVTMSAVRKAQNAGLDVLWLTNLLPKPLDDDYWAKRKPLNADYEAKRKSLYADYEAKYKPLDDDYEAKRKSLYADYEAKYKPLDDDYEAKYKPLDDDYEAKRIKLLLTYLRKVPEGGRE